MNHSRLLGLLLLGLLPVQLLHVLVDLGEHLVLEHRRPLLRLLELVELVEVGVHLGHQLVAVCVERFRLAVGRGHFGVGLGRPDLVLEGRVLDLALARDGLYVGHGYGSGCVASFCSILSIAARLIFYGEGIEAHGEW